MQARKGKVKNGRFKEKPEKPILRDIVYSVELLKYDDNSNRITNEVLKFEEYY